MVGIDRSIRPIPLRHLLELAIACLVLAAAGCAARETAEQVSETCAVSAGQFLDLEEHVYWLVNRRRAMRNLEPLSLDVRVSTMARRHSQAMADGEVPIGHSGFRSRVSGLAPCIRILGASENVTVIASRRYMAPLIGVAEWVDSPPHRENLYGRYDLTGVGIVLGGDGHYYVTQVYLRTR